MMALTARQQLVLDFVLESIRDRGYPPTLREIGTRMGIRSTNGVNDHLRALERKGYIVRDDLKSRGMRPTERAHMLHGIAPPQTGDPAIPEDFVEVCVLGRVVVGMPLLANENVVAIMRVERKMLGPGASEVFGFKMHGDSMAADGILSGDVLFVRKQLSALRGQMVLALIGDEATVRYYYPERDHVRFQPAHKFMAPIYVRASDFKPTMLLGVVVGMYRPIP